MVAAAAAAWNGTTWLDYGASALVLTYLDSESLCQSEAVSKSFKESAAGAWLVLSTNNALAEDELGVPPKTLVLRAELSLRAASLWQQLRATPSFASLIQSTPDYVAWSYAVCDEQVAHLNLAKAIKFDHGRHSALIGRYYL